VTGVSNVIAAPFLGNRSDVIGYRRVLLICLAGATLTTLPQAFTDSYWTFTAQRFAVGLFIGGILPTANALVGRLVPRAERGTVYGITASAMFLGNSMGPLTGGAVAAAFRTALGVSGDRCGAAAEPGVGLLSGAGIH
jgi:DHA1 family multidrug resistance protein-like MFS transporter